MLSDGKAEIDKFKKTVEGGVANAKAVYKEVTGIWGWLKSLLSGAQEKKKIAAAPLPEVVDTSKKITKRQPEPELSYEEFQARSVHEICEHLKIYFEAIRQLKVHCRELEEQSLTTEKVADSAIDRIEIEWQLKQLSTQVREAMTYTPESLGLHDLYKRFLQMYEQILEEQEFARDMKAKKERDSKWQQEHRKEILTYKLMYAAVVAIVLMEVMGLYFTL